MNRLTQVPVQIEYDTLIAEEVGQAFGATIVALYCADEVHYQRLPMSLRHDGILVGKCSYHPQTNRAYYRSNMASMVVSVVHPYTIDKVMSMTNEELIAEGYLNIHKRGRVTSFIPTEKYRQTLVEHYEE